MTCFTSQNFGKEYGSESRPFKVAKKVNFSNIDGNTFGESWLKYQSSALLGTSLQNNSMLGNILITCVNS